METLTITVPVDAQTAQAYHEASPELKKKLELLLSLRLRDVISRPPRPLSVIMDEIGQQAEANGMTPEILAEILREH